MNRTRRAYLSAAASAADLLADPAVAAAWDRPSALAEFGVSGLAGHLAAQVLFVPAALDAPVPDEAPVALLDHYRGAWLDADVDEPVMVMIREGGEKVAEPGPEELVRSVRATLSALEPVFAEAPADRLVRFERGPWSLTLDDYLTTRMMELAVHADDLAVSVGVPTPELPAEVTGPVLDLLARLSVRRHGAVAVMRAYSRAERAPESIAAF